MSIELLKSVHCVGEANLHLQFTPAFRQDVFADVLIRILMRDYMLYQAKRKGFTISALGFGDDHFHVFVTQWKNFSPAKLAQLLKGFTARQMRKHHRELFGNKLWGNKFWSGGYFYRTVGAVNTETVKHYVADSQEYRADVNNMQRTLIEFGA